jgi:predicted nucleic acid-binding protein
MTTGVDEPTFVDANIRIYASEQRAPLHADALHTMEELYDAGVALWVSRQVMREYLAALTRSQTWGMPQPLPRLLDEVRRFETLFHVAEDGPDVARRLLSLLVTIPSGGKQIHDANIVATMLAYGIPRLLTHNVNDFRRFAGYIEVIPLTPR